MKKPLVLLVLLALPALVLGYLLFDVREEATPRSELGDTESARTSSTEDDESKAAEPERLLDPVEASPAELTREPPAESRRRGASGAAREDRRVDPGSARWLEVEIALPAGVPVEEDVTLLAFARGAGLGTSLDAVLGPAGNLELPEAVLAGPDGRLQWDEAPVAWNDTTRVGIPSDAADAVLVLRSRYVFAHVTQVEGEALGDTIELETVPGAWVTGRVTFPAGAEARGATLADATVGLQRLGFGSRDDSGHDERTLRLDEEGRFALRAIAADESYLVHARTEGLVPWYDITFRAPAGAHEELEIALELGGQLAGRVTGEDGTPIEDALVSLDREGPMAGFFASMTGSNEGALTDADGRWSVSGVPAGTCSLEVSAKGWRDGGLEDLELADGQVLEGLVVTLVRAASISGHVVWADGTPARGLPVFLNGAPELGDLGGPDRPGRRRGDPTDARGAFTHEGLQDATYGVYTLGVRDQNGPLDPESEDFRTGAIQEVWYAGATDVPAGTNDLVLTLRPPLVLSGRVVDTAGVPVAKFSVNAMARSVEARPPGSGPRRSVEDEDGRFELLRMYPGRWELVVDGEACSPMNEPLEVVVPLATPLEIVLQRAITLHGLVVDPGGQPLNDASVVASTSSNPFQGESWVEDAETGEDGRFTLEGCPPDGCFLVAAHAEWASSERLSVGPGEGTEAHPLLLRLRLGATITGEVRDDEGRPQAGMNISATSGTQLGFGGDADAVSDEEGRFTVQRIEPGRVTVVAMPGQEAMLEAFAASEGDEQALANGILGQMRSKTVEVADGETKHVVLGPAPGEPVRLHGTLSRAGETESGYSITAVAEGQAMLGGMEAAVTDANGSYELRLDRPGAYVLVVSEQAFGSPLLTRAIDVPAGADHREDLEIPSASLSGRVLAPDGTPAAGVPVSLFTYEVLSLFDLGANSDVETDTDGRFRFENVRTGVYEVRAGTTGDPDDFGAGPYGATVLGGVRVAGERSVEGLELRLREAASLRGVVLDTEGRPVAGAAIHVRDERGNVVLPIAFTTSDAAGKFRVPGLAEGRVSAFARTESGCTPEVGPIEIRAGGEPESPVELRLEPGCRLDVEVLADGELARARVLVTDEAGRRVNGLLTMPQVARMATEGFDSRQRVVGPLAPGTYTITAEAEDGTTARKQVTVRPGVEERGVTLRLR